MNFDKQNHRNTSRERDNSISKWDKLMFRKTITKDEKRSKLSIQSEKSTVNTTAVAGSWIGAIGTILSAIGSTPSTIFTDQTLKDFNLIGNILEAGGSAIVAESEDQLLNIVGNQISAIGNLTVVAGILSDNEQSGQLLEKQGDLLQIVGLGITINTEGQLTLIETIANTGNIIQLIGNVIQVLADTETEEGRVMGAVGGWIQAVGAVITALATE